MTNEQILKKAIEKAVGNGYNPMEDMGRIEKVEAAVGDGAWLYTKDGDGGYYCTYTIIFSHSFAKAFWGEESTCAGCGKLSYSSADVIPYEKIGKEYCGSYYNCSYSVGAWQYHLQQMVLEEELLKYIERFL